MKNLLTNAAIGFTGIAMIGMFSFAGAVPAQAQSNAQLQQMIQQLLQQVAQLQAQLNAGQGTTLTGCQAQFTQNLTVGSRGSQVRQLQQYLNSFPSIQVAASGPGSPGQETSYFGPLTRSAVVQYQNQYRAQILTPVGLTSGTGFWGPSSRSHANSICAQRQSDADDDDQDGEDPTDPDDDDELEGGEGTIDNYSVLGTPSNEELSEGDTEEVMAFEFEAGGSDLRVQRVDFIFEADGTLNEEEPWRFIEEMTLYHNGEEVAQRDASDDDDWSEEGDDSNRGASGADEFRFRFSNVNTIVREGNTAEFTLEVTTRDNLDSGDLPQEFLVSVGDGPNSDQGIRAVDAEGINQYGGDASDTTTFTFAETTIGDLTVRGHDDNPDERAVEIDSDNRTDNVSALVFEMEADNQDIEIEDLVITASSTGNDVQDMVSRFRLLSGGSTIATESVTNSGTSVTITFDNVGIELEDGEETEFTIEVDLRETNNQSRYQDGDTLKVSVDASDFTAEEITGDGDDLASGDLSGTVDGGTMHLYETAPSFTLRSTSESSGSADSGGDVHDGSYTIRFAVTADEDEDIYLPFYSSNNANSIVATTTDGTGTVISIPSFTATLSRHSDSDSSVSRQNNTWRIPSGRTGVFTLSASADNEGGSSDRFVATKITSLKWNTSDSTSGLTEFTWGLDDWETDPILLDN